MITRLYGIEDGMRILRGSFGWVQGGVGWYIWAGASFYYEGTE